MRSREEEKRRGRGGVRGEGEQKRIQKGRREKGEEKERGGGGGGSEERESVGGGGSPK